MPEYSSYRRIAQTGQDGGKRNDLLQTSRTNNNINAKN